MLKREQTRKRDRGWSRVIVHADMDAFYASVEQLDNPELRGQPVLVGPKSGRGVVLTASYEARPYKVGSAMPMVTARERCPEAIIVPPRFDRYRELSNRIMAVFRDFSPQVEALSLDEAFIDMSGAEPFFGRPESVGRKIKEAVTEATGGLTVTVGISDTKYVAKVASGYDKPDGLTIVEPAEAKVWLSPLPVSRLWGAGRKTQERLRLAGFETIGQVAAANPQELAQCFGKVGERFYRLANAQDLRAVVGGSNAKSISSERTLEVDIGPGKDLDFYLRRAADDVGRRLRREKYAAHGIRVKLKTSDFRILTRQQRLTEQTQSSETLYRMAKELSLQIAGEGPFRLVGVCAYDLASYDERMVETDQLDLELGRTKPGAAVLEKTLDAVNERFGANTVHRAADLMRRKDLGIEMHHEIAESRDRRN
jgi:DNA polymerase-4